MEPEGFAGNVTEIALVTPHPYYRLVNWRILHYIQKNMR